MNTVLPAPGPSWMSAPRITPSASCVRSATTPVSSAALCAREALLISNRPGGEELVEMRLVLLGQPEPRAAQFLVQSGFGQPAPHELETQVHQPGVDDVGLAVAPDARELATLVGVPDLGAIEAQLAGVTQQHRHVRQRG